MSYELVEEAEDLISEFLEAIEDFQDAELDEVTEADPWSAAFVIHHMADAELHFASRIINAITKNGPKIVTWDEEEFPDLTRYESRDPSASVMAIEGCDAYVSDILRQQPESVFARMSLHPDAGEMTIKDIVEKMISHRKAHLGQLRSILAAL